MHPVRSGSTLVRADARNARSGRPIRGSGRQREAPSGTHRELALWVCNCGELQHWRTFNGARALRKGSSRGSGGRHQRQPRGRALPSASGRVVGKPRIVPVTTMPRRPPSTWYPLDMRADRTRAHWLRSLRCEAGDEVGCPLLGVGAVVGVRNGSRRLEREVRGFRCP